MTKTPDPRVQLPANPSLEWLRKAAKDLVAELRAQRPDAQLADAQLEIARRYGHASWRKLKAFVDGVHDDGERLRAAVRAGDLATVTAILDDEPALVGALEDLHERERPSDEPRMGLLHLSVAEGNRAMVELLVARGAPLDARNSGGRTALHDCFELNRDPIARFLIDSGATVDVCAAAAYGEHARLEAILRADPDQANDLSTHISPLGWAGYAHDAESARILLAHGAIVDRPPHDDSAWASICHVAAIPVARVLLEHGADPNFQDPDGDTPLHRVLASRLVRDPTDFVRLLLDHGADPDRQNRAGRSPVDDALARQGEEAETYFPRRPLGAKHLEPAIELLRAASRAGTSR
ncbi:MAG TPA: ankyrin repeat domain-containing protein [Kofleriaceae bacterium]|nr:ankyrin repeat domain-containing protein [Kofleriaceae bacterium]